ncbi:N-formylglutamate deformylase [Lichenihabitans sp. Uapishka_5]|uniref:N-formylglutamate deformylase n=1 Tax=Lichenihabitans sp. Uapishka_5 TaxID=3037302 RepID=UPI0029E7D95D|nr:N-formylglutamate deformylase [Lichenihabitans sp. Uapishka_5]MDX7951560.1 N-formylglutamate deformylase [Lichenihabitans sp. Uapishka_5]
MSPVEVAEGGSPVILAFPHTGTWVPAEIAARLNPEGLGLRDTDWHIERLYDGLLPDATTVRATFHRYVIDANRDPSGTSLYPGQNTTALVPTTTFDDAPIWRDGAAPDAAAIADRVARFHAPYHAALAAEIARVKARHGVAVVYDCHSIRSRVPFLFDGTLPDFNIGTDGGRTCDPTIEAVAVAACREAAGTTSVLNGRFRGGWTTRHYGHPEAGVHAIQMELAQSSHLETEVPPFALDSAKAARLRPVLQTLLTRLATVAATLSSLP